MTQTQQHCSTNDQLITFLRGQLSAQEESELQLHLNDCVLCRERLENAAADANAWNEAKQFFGSGALQTSSDVSTSSHDEATQGSQRIRQVLDSLGPTDDPESLGRIGSYEVTGVVGAGGMGVVLKAHDRSLDRIVAIKVMSPHLASSGSARKRFAREAKAAAAVLHPNVIAIHGVASDAACPYLVMPYVRGSSLQKRIDSQGPLPLKDTLRIGSQIAAGLAAAHEQGLVHRDIKPANILLEEGVERVTITDFGLARAVDDASMTCSGVIAGTPQYMSPEQTRGEPIDARSDLFSLGSVLYTMCAGRSPFRAETTYGVLHRIANDNPTPVCEVNSDVPVWLGHIIERLLAKRAEDRFESAAQVAALLEGCLAHVQQPTAIPLPVGVQALAAQSQLRAGEIPKSNRLKAIHQRIPPIGKFIAAAAGAIALFFAGVLIVLELDKGTLTIESEIDDVPIRIMQGEKVVKQLTVTKSGNSLRVAAGTYQIEIAGEFPLVSVANGIVSMKRGETETVTITITQSTTANTKGAPMRSDLSAVSTRLLADAIRQFNELQKSDPVGSKQPLLTDDEVIAAVRAMSREITSINVTESNYKVLRDAIERGQIPNEWTVESSNQFKLSNGRVGERWTVQLSLRRGESSPQRYVFRSRYVKIEPETSAVKLPMPEGNVSIAEWLAKVNAPDPNIYAPLPDLPVTEQEIVAALTDLIDKDQSTEFAPQRKTLQEVIETRSLPKEAELSVFRPQRHRGYVSRWSNREGFENEDWTLRFKYPYTQGEKQIVTAVHLGFRSINSRPVDHVTDDEIHWGSVAQDGLQFGVAIEEVTLPDKSDLASTGAMAYKPHFYFRNPGKTDSTSIQLSDMYQHYEIDARTATGEQLPSKRRQGYYWISRVIFPDPLNSESRIYTRASPFVVGTYVQTLFEDSLSLEPPDGQSFESFPSVAVNSPRNTPLRIRISIPHPLFSDSTRLLSGEIRLPPLKLIQTNADTAESEKAKDEAAKAWLRRPVVGSTLDGKSFQLAGHDALMDCVMRNNSETLNRLLTMDKYDLDLSPGNGQWTLLQIALLHDCVETTSLLLHYGANPSFASKGTPLPLELAQRSGRKELVALVQKYLESNAPHSQTNVDVRQIFADIDCEVTKILVGHNSVVTRGQLLLEMRNDELQLELTKTSDQMKESNAELDRITKKIKDNKDLPIDEVIEMVRDRSELQKRVATLTEQMKRLRERYELLYVKSTVAGKIVTKDVEQLLNNRPVVAGQVLLEIAVGPSRNTIENAENNEKTAMHVNKDGEVVTIPLKAEWVSEEWMKRNIGRRHLSIVADGTIQDEAKPNVVNRVQRGILHDCRLESYEKMSRDGVEYWNARLFVPRKPVYPKDALWFKDAIDTYRIGDRHTPVPSATLLQDNPQVKLDEAMKEGHVFRLDYVNDDFENNLPTVKTESIQTVQLNEKAKDFLLRLKGEWKLDAMSFDGRELSKSSDSNMIATLTDHTLAKFIGSRPLGPVYEITDMNAQTDPVEISLTRELKEQVGTLESLLSLESGVLTLATPIFPQNSRPQSLQPARGVKIERWTRIAELKGHWRMVYQPLDGTLETSEVGYSLSIDEQTITLAGHSLPYKLLPQNAIQWSYPPEYAGIKFASGKYEVIDQDHVRLAVRYHESLIDATAWPKTASSNNPEEGVDYCLLIRSELPKSDRSQQREPSEEEMAESFLRHKRTRMMEPAKGNGEKVEVAMGETDDLRLGQSYKIKLLVLASDDLKPVAGATVEVTLIEDYKGVTGDGGFADFKTNEVGIATIDKSLWPGRYQIQIRAPKDSRYRDTEFSKDESILIVHEDGRYSPREFRLVVDDKKPTK